MQPKFVCNTRVSTLNPSSLPATLNLAHKSPPPLEWLCRVRLQIPVLSEIYVSLCFVFFLQKKLILLYTYPDVIVINITRAGARRGARVKIARVIVDDWVVEALIIVFGIVAQLIQVIYPKH